MAPELIREIGEQLQYCDGTKQADVYSFAIVCSEIITRRAAWGLENDDKIDGKFFLDLKKIVN